VKDLEEETVNLNLRRGRKMRIKKIQTHPSK
jgi:hypothetical protein